MRLAAVFFDHKYIGDEPHNHKRAIEELQFFPDLSEMRYTRRESSWVEPFSGFFQLYRTIYLDR